MVEYFDKFLKQLKRLIGIDLKLATWEKYENSKNHIQGFIKWKFKTRDLPLKDVKSNFLAEFEYYSKVEKHCNQTTVNKIIQRFRKSIKMALAGSYLEKDPFILYKAKRIKKEMVFLSVDELKQLETYEFSQPRLQQVKDWFVFSCYTGLAYAEIRSLRKQHIVKGFDGELWIEMKREKTQKNISVPLLPKARELIDKYFDENSEVVFEVLSNQKYNSYLKKFQAS